jgi:protein-disulfide isomerase
MENDIKPWLKNLWGKLVIIFLTIILIFLVAIGFYIYDSAKVAKEKIDLKLSGQQYDAAGSDLPAQAGHYWTGTDKAKITIVEFGDFACPVCKQAFSTIREIGLKYKNDIKLIWRDYPVVAEYSDLLALGGRCAGEQGLFWPMHDKLFQNQGVNTANQLNALANQIGADTTRFNNCMTKQKYLPQIKKDLADGQTFGNTGTPTYFINGYKIPGNIPYDTFVKIIEELKK